MTKTVKKLNHGVIEKLNNKFDKQNIKYIDKD